jgi:hypothetical protein
MVRRSAVSSRARTTSDTHCDCIEGLGVGAFRAMKSAPGEGHLVVSIQAGL